MSKAHYCIRVSDETINDGEERAIHKQSITHESTNGGSYPYRLKILLQLQYDFGIGI